MVLGITVLCNKFQGELQHKKHCRAPRNHAPTLKTNGVLFLIEQLNLKLNIPLPQVAEQCGGIPHLAHSRSRRYEVKLALLRGGGGGAPLLHF
jgi:hypothetical protein